jgi:hypothetical protein
VLSAESALSPQPAKQEQTIVSAIVAANIFFSFILNFPFVFFRQKAYKQKNAKLDNPD